MVDNGKMYRWGGDELEVVAWICNIGDALSASIGCELATRISIECGWNKFLKLQPLICSRHLFLKTRRHGYATYARSVMLHGSETWVLTKVDLQRLQRNDRAMIRHVCGVKPQEVSQVRSQDMLNKLGLLDLETVLREKRLR